MDEHELPFVYEQSFKVLPTFAAVLGWPGFWVRDLDTGIDWVNVVAGEQGLVLHRPLARRGTAIGRTRVTGSVVPHSRSAPQLTAPSTSS